jgi:hypothetical protein
MNPQIMNTAMSTVACRARSHAPLSLRLAGMGWAAQTDDKPLGDVRLGYGSRLTVMPTLTQAIGSRVERGATGPYLWRPPD